MPKLIISLGQHYVRYTNRSYQRTGTLWDSRYKSSLVQAETYLLGCQRYIELNPVRAAMVEDPAHYRWTSYRFNALGQTDSRITPHALYRSLGQSDQDRQAAYRALLRAHLARAIFSLAVLKYRIVDLLLARAVNPSRACPCLRLVVILIVSGPPTGGSHPIT